MPPSYVLHHIFNMSLSLQRVPVLCKMSCLVPVPKMSRPIGSKDYRLVALTSHIMKTLGRLVLGQLWPMVRPLLDSLQFAYPRQLGVEDAIIYLLNYVYIYLDFSSAISTVQPALLGERLTAMQVDAPLVS